MANEEYDVFISYSRKDYVDENDKVIPGNVVSKIKDCLSAAGISYWFDEEGIYYGDTFTEKIPANIEKSKVFLFLASVNSNQSKWTSKEIGCAENMEKRIIPVRIDKSPYNKSVMFRIADLDYVKYYSNPDKGLDDIVDAVKKALKDIEDEERRIKEEEERKKREEQRRREEEQKKREEEERRHKAEQKKAIADIKSNCVQLNGEESKISIQREGLIIRLEEIEDTEEREKLRKYILTSSPFQKKLDEQIEKLNKREKELDKVLTTAESALEAKEKELLSLKAEYEKKLNDFEQIKNKNAKEIYNINLLISSLKTTIKKSEEQIKEKSNRITELEATLRSTKQEAERAKKELEDSKNIINSLETQLKSYTQQQTSKPTQKTPTPYTTHLTGIKGGSQLIVFSEGSYYQGYRYGFKNKTTDKIIIPAKWKNALPFVEGFAAVQDPSSSRWGFIDTNGVHITSYEWKSVMSFSEGLAAVMNYSDNWGFIDKFGKLVIKCQYHSVKSFINGLATVYDLKGCFKIKKDGTKLF